MEILKLKHADEHDETVSIIHFHLSRIMQIISKSFCLNLHRYKVKLNACLCPNSAPGNEMQCVQATCTFACS
jgi:hypothetical protein